MNFGQTASNSCVATSLVHAVSCSTKALALQQERFEQGEKAGYAELCKQLTQWKSEDSTAWLAETPSQPLQQTLKDLERATNFFAKRADFPRFKEGFIRQLPLSARFQARPIAVCFLAKLGWLRYRNSRGMRSERSRTLQVSQSAVSGMPLSRPSEEVDVPVHQSTAVGLDMGIKRCHCPVRWQPQKTHSNGFQGSRKPCAKRSRR